MLLGYGHRSSDLLWHREQGGLMWSVSEAAVGHKCEGCRRLIAIGERMAKALERGPYCASCSPVSLTERPPRRTLPPPEPSTGRPVPQAILSGEYVTGLDLARKYFPSNPHSGRNQIYRWCKRGLIPGAHKSGGLWLIPAKELESGVARRGRYWAAKERLLKREEPVDVRPVARERERHLTAAEAAWYLFPHAPLSSAATYVTAMCRRGEFSGAYKCGRAWRIPVSQVAEIDGLGDKGTRRAA